MAYVNQSETFQHGYRLARFVRAAGPALTRYRLYRRTLAELDGMSARELDDLGIARADIRRIARDAVYGT